MFEERQIPNRYVPPGDFQLCLQNFHCDRILEAMLLENQARALHLLYARRERTESTTCNKETNNISDFVVTSKPTVESIEWIRCVIAWMLLIWKFKYL